MGADLISTFAWYRTGPAETRRVEYGNGQGHDYEWRPPLLDFEAGRTKAREVAATWTRDQLDRAVDNRAAYNDRDDDLDEPALLEADRETVLKAVLEDIDEIESIFTGTYPDGRKAHWRDVDQRSFDNGNVGFIFTAGMSWGDTPTEAYDHLTNLQDEDYTPNGPEIWQAIGFLVDPYTCIGLLP